ncbi:DUF960 domain-containing protein [Enterococcus durans]|nr:DUF960 domain-containing protein [Enterococcus durans]
MFQNKGQRYVTKGVMDSLPVELQALRKKEIKSWFIVKKNRKKEKSI